MWLCLNDQLELPYEWSKEFHLNLFRNHRVIKMPNDVGLKENVGLRDHGHVTLRGPDGKIKQVVEFT